MGGYRNIRALATQGIEIAMNENSLQRKWTVLRDRKMQEMENTMKLSHIYIV